MNNNTIVLTLTHCTHTDSLQHIFTVPPQTAGLLTPTHVHTDTGNLVQEISISEAQRLIGTEGMLVRRKNRTRTAVRADHGQLLFVSPLNCSHHKRKLITIFQPLLMIYRMPFNDMYIFYISLLRP